MGVHLQNGVSGWDGFKDTLKVGTCDKLGRQDRVSPFKVSFLHVNVIKELIPINMVRRATGRRNNEVSI
jgi:hypothetical protein